MSDLFGNHIVGFPTRWLNYYTQIRLAQLRWTGHIIRMPDERLPKEVFYRELQEGMHSHGGQKKHYKDTLKASHKDFTNQ